MLSYRIDNIYSAMALDEVLFELTQKKENGYIRLSSSMNKSITLGYFQKYKAEYGTKYKYITRRLTGGGLVEHDNDLILSLLFKYTDKKNVSFYYEIIHNAIFLALKDTGYRADIYKKKVKINSSKESLCFSSPVQYDIMLDKQKIVGGAMSRKKGAFLYQGSLQFVKSIDNKLIKEIQKLLFSYLAKALDFEIVGIKDNLQSIKKAEMLSIQKYQNIDWIRKY